MENFVYISILAMIGTGLWNINLINAKTYSNENIFTWFRIVLIISGILSFLSFIVYRPDIKLNTIRWIPIIYSSILLVAYQTLLLYSFSNSSSAFPLIIINLNVALVFLYQVIFLNKQLSKKLITLIILYILVGSCIIYLKNK